MLALQNFVYHVRFGCHMCDTTEFRVYGIKVDKQNWVDDH